MSVNKNIDKKYKELDGILETTLKMLDLDTNSFTQEGNGKLGLGFYVYFDIKDAAFMDIYCYEFRMNFTYEWSKDDSYVKDKYCTFKETSILYARKVELMLKNKTLEFKELETHLDAEEGIKSFIELIDKRLENAII